MKTKLFAYNFAVGFGCASAGYWLLNLFFEDRVFGALFRMFLYHVRHPFQYIAVVCLVYAAIASVAARRVSRLSGWRRFLAVVAVMLISVEVASIPGGVLWTIHDMQAGYFPKGAAFWSALGWGATTGLQVGWLVIGLSIPYNVLGIVAGYGITISGLRITQAAPASDDCVG